ncbi:hypothetical protein [Paucisalibacillus globulus]|uniref:hypothetical protein n=1 Tax=Paucisalibacillus globulus TaxID=351095 RepID=UPI0020D0BD33|nr:hypothetical protein [Paucisalibacillus globulus]
MKETRQEKFRRIAETRMTRIFVNMNLIANLSNKNQYEYSEEDVNKLFQAYEDKGAEIRLFFEPNYISNEPLKETFSFSDALEKSNGNESKHKKFLRIAENRMNRIFADMNLIANLSNKRNYTYTIQEVDELFQAYDDKGNEIRAFFDPLKEEFTFSN